MAISNSYDMIFDKFRGSIPLSFLRSLAFVSSKLNTKKSVKGSAGLFMISEAALKAFDKRFPKFQPPTPHKVTALADPVLNTVIAVWIINNIVNYFAKKYPKTMSENWNSSDYVALIVHGYSVGYTEPKGIGAAIKTFEEKSPDKLSIDNVAIVSKQLGLGARKYDPKAISRAKAVSNIYISDLGGKAPIERPSILTPTVSTKEGSGIGLAAAAIGVVGVGYLLMKGKK